MGRVLFCTVILTVVIACAEKQPEINSDKTYRPVSNAEYDFAGIVLSGQLGSDIRSEINSPQEFYSYLQPSESTGGGGNTQENLLASQNQILINTTNQPVITSSLNEDNSVETLSARGLDVFAEVLTLVVNGEVLNINEDSEVKYNLLSNDLDTAGNLIFISSYTTSRQGGIVQIEAFGNLFYAPPKNFSGSDWFSYTVTNDKGETKSATVIVYVAAVNDIPISKPDFIIVEENKMSDIDVLLNDIGLGDGVQLSIVSNPVNGSLAMINNRFQYTPFNQFTGYDSFVYRVTDSNGDISSANVSLTIQCDLNCTNTFPLQLSWDASPSLNIIGYRLYVWNAALSYFDVTDMGNVTQFNYPLSAVGDFFFAVSAINNREDESALSDVVRMTF